MTGLAAGPVGNPPMLRIRKVASTSRRRWITELFADFMFLWVGERKPIVGERLLDVPFTQVELLDVSPICQARPRCRGGPRPIAPVVEPAQLPELNGVEFQGVACRRGCTQRRQSRTASPRTSALELAEASILKRLPELYTLGLRRMSTLGLCWCLLRRVNCCSARTTALHCKAPGRWQALVRSLRGRL